MVVLDESRVPDRVSTAFLSCDGNGSGFLEYRELRAALQQCCDLDLGSVDARLMEQYDDKPDGWLDLHELCGRRRHEPCMLRSA